MRACRSRGRSWILLSLFTHTCTLVILHSSGMPLLLAADRLRQHAVTEPGLGFLPILVFLGLLSHAVDWADGPVPDSNLIRWVDPRADITR